MATQPGAIRVTNDSNSPIRVAITTQDNKVVRSISYGQPLELRKATDVTIQPTSNTGDAVVYNASTNTFEVKQVTAGAVTSVKGGTF